MNRVILLAAVLVATVQLKAQQTPFPDGGFENCWELFKNSHPTKPDYWDFKEDYFLSTLNQLYELEGEMGDAPLTVERITGNDVYDGIYSIKLISKPMTLGGEVIFLPGVAATIFIEFDPPNCILGEPFTARPDALKGFHKYAPVNGDSAAIEVWLQKNGTVLGSGKQVITEGIPNWTEFNVPITYTSNETPDTIVVIFAASAKYDFTNIETLMQCKGQEGSTLCLDNVEYVYNPEGVKEFLHPAVKMSVYPNPSAERINLQIAKETAGTVIIYDYLSRKVGEYSLCGTQIDIDIQDYAAGSYLINIVENARVITTGRFVKTEK